MHYYTHNIGDYAVETKYMTFEQKGMYIDMLDRYASTGKPLDSQWIATLKRLTSSDAVDVVLALCFEEKEGDFHHKKMDEMLSAYEATVEKNRRNAQKRSKNQRPTDDGKPVATQSQPSGYPSGSLTNNQEPITNNQLKEKVKKEKLVAQKPEELTQEKWDQWLGYRKNIKKLKEEFSIFALKLMQTEAQKAGISLERAIDITMENEWKGFKAVYYENLNRGSNHVPDRSAFKVRQKPKDEEFDQDVMNALEGFA